MQLNLLNSSIMEPQNTRFQALIIEWLVNAIIIPSCSAMILKVHRVLMHSELVKANNAEELSFIPVEFSQFNITFVTVVVWGAVFQYKHHHSLLVNQKCNSISHGSVHVNLKGISMIGQFLLRYLFPIFSYTLIYLKVLGH